MPALHDDGGSTALNQFRVGDRNVVATSFDVQEASIADLRAAIETGRVTAVRLLEAYLGRIAAYDRGGIS